MSMGLKQADQSTPFLSDPPVTLNGWAQGPCRITLEIRSMVPLTCRSDRMAIQAVHDMVYISIMMMQGCMQGDRSE